MEQYLDKLVYIVGLVFVAIGILYRHWTKFEVIYQSAKSAFFIVEEVARQEGLVTEEKIALFKEKFKKLMAWAGRWVTKENLELALELAKKFSAKYRKTPPVINEKQPTETLHIIDGDETIILVPKEV